MKLNELPIGTRIYYTGDMANIEHFGTITAHKSGRFGDQIEITPDADAERKPYWIPPEMFSVKYLGHGGTRFVTEAAYHAWRESQMAAYLNR
jgi:hypothetical protein